MINEEILNRINILKKKLISIEKSISIVNTQIKYIETTNYGIAGIQIGSSITLDLSREEVKILLNNILTGLLELKDTNKKEFDSYIISKQV